MAILKGRVRYRPALIWVRKKWQHFAQDSMHVPHQWVCLTRTGTAMRRSTSKCWYISIHRFLCSGKSPTSESWKSVIKYSIALLDIAFVRATNRNMFLYEMRILSKTVVCWYILELFCVGLTLIYNSKTRDLNIPCPLLLFAISFLSNHLGILTRRVSLCQNPYKILWIERFPCWSRG